MEKSEKRKEKNTNASGISEYDSLVEMKRNESFFFDICKKTTKKYHADSTKRKLSNGYVLFQNIQKNLTFE